MPRTSAEVLIGPGTLYLAPFGTVFPIDPGVAPAAAWIDIGYSEEGWSFNVDRTIEEIEVAEEQEPIDLLQTRRDIHVVGMSAQASMDNLKLAYGGGTVTVLTVPARKRFDPPTSDVMTKLALLLRVTAPSGFARDVAVPKVVQVAALEMAYKKAPDKVVLAMDWRVIKDVGVLPFTITDLTA